MTNQSFTRAPRPHTGRRCWQGSPDDRAQTARRALAASPDSLSLSIATAAIDPQVTCPALQAWLPLHGSGRQVRLIDLGSAVPDLAWLARERGYLCR